MLKATTMVLLMLGLLACAQAPVKEIGSFSTSQLQMLQDSDQDGVIQQRDRCQQTGSEALVSVDGCSSLQTSDFTTIHAVQFYRHDRLLACAELRSLLALIKHFKLADDPLELTLLAHQVQGKPALDRTLFDARIAYLKERLWAEYRHQLPTIHVRIDTVTANDRYVMQPNQIGIKARNMATNEVLKWHIFSMEGRESEDVEAHSASGW